MSAVKQSEEQVVESSNGYFVLYNLLAHSSAWKKQIAMIADEGGVLTPCELGEMAASHGLWEDANPYAANTPEFEGFDRGLNS